MSQTKINRLYNQIGNTEVDTTRKIKALEYNGTVDYAEVHKLIKEHTTEVSKLYKEIHDLSRDMQSAELLIFNEHLQNGRKPNLR